MDIAIIIISYNVRDLLRACLESVYAGLERSPDLQAGVWIVDNASTDGSADMVRRDFPDARLIASPDNLGFAAGNNLALRRLGFEAVTAEAPQSAVATESPALPDHGSGKSQQMPEMPRHVLLLNSDTEVQEDAPARMAAFLDEHPQAGGCGAQLAYPDGRFQHSAFRFPDLAQIYLDLFPPRGRLNTLLETRLNGRYSQESYQSGRPFPVDFVLGAALMVRAEAIREAGLLDESYFMYCEEMDWQRRLKAAGWPMFCLPTARIIHHGGASASQFRGPMFVALWRSRLRYFQRYHSPRFNQVAHGLIRRGLEAEAHRAIQANPPDLPQRLVAFDEVGRLLGR